MSEQTTHDQATTLNPSDKLSMDIRVRLSIMMVIQYAIWGTWWGILSIYLKKIGFNGEQVGSIYATTAIASIIAPMILGQIADRWIPTQYLLGVLFLWGGGTLFAASRYTDFVTFYTLILTWAILFIPTITLTNSLSFHHIPNAAKHFPSIRVFGTIGWIIAGIFVGYTLDDKTVVPMQVGCVLSIVMGVYCLFALPHTSPSGKSDEMFAFLRAVSLLRNPTFALFMLVSFCISIVLSGYFVFVGQFLDQLQVKNIAAVMTVGQMTEMILLPFLPFFLKRLGMKMTLLLGMGAWGIRYLLFASGLPIPWIVVGIALHGICYDFFFVAAYIHVDNKAGSAMRASAQGFYNLVTMGLGMYLGAEYFGDLVLRNTDEVTKMTNWTPVWATPAIGVLICLIVFAIGFRNDKKEVPQV